MNTVKNILGATAVIALFAVLIIPGSGVVLLMLLYFAFPVFLIGMLAYYAGKAVWQWLGMSPAESYKDWEVAP